MKTICSECSFLFRVPKQMEGRSVKCPECRHQIEILKSPASAGVRILKVAVPPIAAALISAIMCWGYFIGREQLETSQKVSDTEKFFEKKLAIQQQKNQGLAKQLRSKTHAATESALRGAEEIDTLNAEIDASHELLDKKDIQINFMIEALTKLNKTVTTESEQKKLQQESNLKQALEKGSDVWSLSGIKSLKVNVSISGNSETYQLKEGDVAAYIQTALEENNIKTTNNNDADNESQDGILSVEIFIVETNDIEVPASLEIRASVRQNARLLRDENIISIGASTWEKRRWHAINQGNADDTVITVIDDLLERFVHDFQASNTL